ncbi:MAG: hypothetical protein WBA10_04000 [Elainellaceae cyanobacterium]
MSRSPPFAPQADPEAEALSSEEFGAIRAVPHRDLNRNAGSVVPPDKGSAVALRPTLP